METAQKEMSQDIERKKRQLVEKNTNMDHFANNIEMINVCEEQAPCNNINFTNDIHMRGVNEKPINILKDTTVQELKQKIIGLITSLRQFQE